MGNLSWVCPNVSQLFSQITGRLLSPYVSLSPDPSRVLLLAGLASVAATRISFWASYLYQNVPLTTPDALVYGLGESLMDGVYLIGTCFFGSDPFGTTIDYVGLGLFLLGSFIETYADTTRKLWKDDPKNAGKYYPHQLSSFIQHPNYLGFLVYRTGFGFLTGNWKFALFWSVFYFLWFYFGSVPDMVEKNLKKYPGYGDYMKRTWKMIPFLY